MERLYIFSRIKIKNTMYENYTEGEGSLYTEKGINYPCTELNEDFL